MKVFSISGINNQNRIKKPLSFQGIVPPLKTEAPLITAVLEKMDVQKEVIAIKELVGLPKDRETRETCADIVSRITAKISEATIPEELNGKPFTPEEASKINELSAERLQYQVRPSTTKGDFASKILKSLMLDANEVTRENASSSPPFFEHCLRNFVKTLRMLQITVGVPDNSHLARMTNPK